MEKLTHHVLAHIYGGKGRNFYDRIMAETDFRPFISRRRLEVTENEIKDAFALIRAEVRESHK